MKINELTGYKKFDIYKKAKEILGGDIRDKPLYATLEEWEAIMDTYGFKHLGTGSYGSAYEHPSYPWIYKVFKHDDAYLQFYKYFKKHQNNPNLPKRLGPIIKIGPDSYAVKLEKLRPISPGEWNIVDKILETFQEYFISLNYDPDYEMTSDVKRMMQQYPGMYEIANALFYSNVFSSNAYPDLHSGNVMMRGNVPVIIDPLVA